MYQRILVPIDGSSTSQRALQEALKLSQPNTQLRLVYVVEEIYPLDVESYTLIDYKLLQEALCETGKRALAQAAERAHQSGIIINTVLLDAHNNRVSQVINEEAKNWQADLIILGTHGRTGLSRLLLGSVAEGVVREANVPVLLVRSE